MNTQRCDWFVLCKNLATSLRTFPFLGTIAVCDECTARLPKGGAA